LELTATHSEAENRERTESRNLQSLCKRAHDDTFCLIFIYLFKSKQRQQPLACYNYGTNITIYMKPINSLNNH